MSQDEKVGEGVPVITPSDPSALPSVGSAITPELAADGDASGSSRANAQAPRKVEGSVPDYDLRSIVNGGVGDFCPVSHLTRPHAGSHVKHTPVVLFVDPQPGDVWTRAEVEVLLNEIMASNNLPAGEKGAWHSGYLYGADVLDIARRHGLILPLRATGRSGRDEGAGSASREPTAGSHAARDGEERTGAPKQQQ